MAPVYMHIFFILVAIDFSICY